MALFKNYVVAINASTYVPINVPAGMDTFSAFTFATADETGCYLSYDGGVTQTYIPDGKGGASLGKTITVNGTLEIISVKGTTATNIGGLIS